MADELILIVDDVALNVELMHDLLRDAGYQVTSAASAAEALESIAESPPDLILMDVQLPDVDGLELTRRLKADAGTARIPVVAITSYAMPGDDERAAEAGCDGYLSKPIDTRTFARYLRRFLPLASPNLHPETPSGGGTE